MKRLVLPLLLVPALAAATEKVPARHAEGAPTITAGTGPGYYLWRDEGGWHLRWTGKKTEKIPVFTGLVSAVGGKLSMIKPAGTTGGDDSVNRLDNTRAMFKSGSADTVEGIDFKTGEGATSLYLELFVDYDVIAPGTVFLGKDRVTPSDISPMLQVDLTAAAPR